MNEKSCTDLYNVVMELENMLDGIAHDFYRNREEHISEVEKLSATTVSSMKKSVLKIPLIRGTSVKEMAGKYEAMRDLEYIRINLERIMRATQDKVSRSVLFSNWAVEELDVLFNGSRNSLRDLAVYLKQCKEMNRSELENEAGQLMEDCLKFTRQHEVRFIQGVCTPESSAIYQSMLDAFRDTFMHLKSFVVKVYRQ